MVLISAPEKSPLDGDFVIGVNDESYDRKKHSCIVSSQDTFVKDGTLVKVLAWYSNERGVLQPHGGHDVADAAIYCATGSQEATISRRTHAWNCDTHP